jgi:Asp/Glu/hydantoin racemase
MRIRYQSMTAFAELGTYAETLKRHANEVISAGVSVEFRGVDPGVYGRLVPGDIFPYPYAKHLVADQALEACFQAAADGCDAFVIGSFSEPHLRCSRAAVDIPVLSLPESSFLTGCSLAERFALITLSPHYARRVSEVVARHGMQSRVAGIFPLGDALTERELSAALTQPDEVLRAFHDAAAQAVAAGADLLLPAEGILNEVMYLNRLASIDGASVMDCVGVTLLHAEMLVAMKGRLGLGPGRLWSYPMASPEMVAELRRNIGRPDY